MSIHLNRALEMVELCNVLGLAAVPRIPTDTMIEAGRKIIDVDAPWLSSAYTAMIDSGALD